MRALIERLRTIWEETPGVLSWGRVFASLTTTTAIWAVVHIVLKSGSLPDAASLAGLGMWAIFPYGVNKVAGAAESFGKKDG